MDRKEKLERAIQYAIDTDYGAYEKALKARETINNASNVCVFGMGKFFREGYPYVKNQLKAEYVCDNSIEEAIREKRETYGLKCITVAELCRLENPVAVCMLGSSYKEVKQQLDNLGIENIHIGDILLNMYTPKFDGQWFKKEKENILKAADVFADELSSDYYVEIICNRIAPGIAEKEFAQMCSEGEYFDTGLFTYSKTESFVDVGAYTGDTIEKFMETVSGEYKKIYAFELEDEIFSTLCSAVSKYDREKLELWNRGVSSADDEKDGKMVCLDSALQGKEATFIKMDIEGYEWDALHGAEKLIGKQLPKLAVCLYHRLDDLWRIPLYIKEINEAYKLYLRHHSPVVWDSVLYARVE